MVMKRMKTGNSTSKEIEGDWLFEFDEEEN